MAINASFSVNVGGSVYDFHGLTDNDISTLNALIEKVNTNSESLTDLQGSLEALTSGSARLTDTDPSTAEASSFEDGVFYLAPVNASGQFVKLNLETMEPDSTQADGVTDTEIAKLDVYYKSSGSMAKIYSMDVNIDFTDFATIAGENTFTAMNTFNAGITLGDTQDASSLADTRVPQYGTVKTYVQGLGYLTEADLSDYAKTADVTSQIEAAKTEITETVTSADYATKTEAQSMADTALTSAKEYTDTAKSEATADAVSQVEAKGYITVSASDSKPEETAVTVGSIFVYPATDLLSGSVD